MFLKLRRPFPSFNRSDHSPGGGGGVGIFEALYMEFQRLVTGMGTISTSHTIVLGPVCFFLSVQTALAFSKVCFLFPPPYVAGFQSLGYALIHSKLDW